MSRTSLRTRLRDSVRISAGAHPRAPCQLPFDSGWHCPDVPLGSGQWYCPISAATPPKSYLPKATLCPPPSGAYQSSPSPHTGGAALTRPSRPARAVPLSPQHPSGSIYPPPVALRPLWILTGFRRLTTPGRRPQPLVLDLSGTFSIITPASPRPSSFPQLAQVRPPRPFGASAE